MTKKVFITGSNGFIGKELISLLETKKIKYDILDRNKVPFNDVSELKKLLQDKDFVIHLAGKMRGERYDFLQANIKSTHYLLEAISSLDKKPVLIFSSTFAVYALQHDILTEKSKKGPRNIYGETKLEAEKLIEKYSKEFKIPSLILRFSNVYGPDMPAYSHSVVATFMDQAIKDIPITINSTGEQKRDFVYVTDAVDALIKCIDLGIKTKRTQILNVCSGIPVSMNELANKIGEVIGKEIEVVYPTHNDVDNGNWIGVNRKAKKVLNWEPKISFEEGIRRCYEKNK